MPKTLIVLMTALIAVFSSSSISAEPIEKARRFVEISGAKRVVLQMTKDFVPAMMQSMSTINPSLDTKKLAKLEVALAEEFEKSVPEFLELYAEIYAQHFTEDELQDVIDFYETPTGKKFKELAPQLTNEGFVAGQALGQSVGTRAFEKLKARGDL